MGRPETSSVRGMAMSMLGNGLGMSGLYEDALSVGEAELSLRRRLGGPEDIILAVQANLAVTCAALGQRDKAARIEEDVYCGRVKLNGKEHEETLRAANNYTSSLIDLERYEEAKSLLRKTLPVARRILGESYGTTLKLRWTYGQSLYMDDGATLDDLREAVTTLEDTERIARRVLGGAHPTTTGIEYDLQKARAARDARETPSPG